MEKAAYKHKCGSVKRKNKRKTELQAAATNPKQYRLNFLTAPQEHEGPQNRNDTAANPGSFVIRNKLDFLHRDSLWDGMGWAGERHRLLFLPSNDGYICI